MRTIFRIAKNEFYTLFYSPIAWFILIIFSFQIYSGFTSLLGYYADTVSLGRSIAPNTTIDLFLRGAGAPLRAVTSYLYLYVPLLSMGLISQEFNNGTIKLLFSSPVTGTQIILGKFLSMMFYGLFLMAILFVLLIVSEFLVPNLFTPTVLTGFLGIYLLFCTYVAIGLFMSTLTSYQMIAALGTLTILSVLNFVGDLGQNIDFVRDISFWLSISGRAEQFLWGLICSEDIIYFVIVTILFIVLSIIRLESDRQNNTKLVKAAKYTGAIVLCLLIGYVTSRPVFKLYYDATENKQHTLTPNSQEILSKIKGDLTITTYVNLMDKNHAYNGFPKNWNNDKKKFEQYIRFKPELQMNYILFYDTIPGQGMTLESMQEEVDKIIVLNDLNPKKILTPKEIREVIDLRSEENKFVRLIETDNGKKTYLRMYDDTRRYPGESEISVALKTLIEKRPLVAFIAGHNERSVDLGGDVNYLKFSKILSQRESLINQGFDPISLYIKNGEIPSEVDILVIADPQIPYSPDELQAVNKYIERGGNLIIAGEPRRSGIVNEITKSLGLGIIPGTLVHTTGDNRPDLLFVPITAESSSISAGLGRISSLGGRVSMPSAGGIGIIEDKGYKITPLVATENVGYWNELETTNFSNEVPVLNPSIGEYEGSIPTALALLKKTGDKEQKIIVLGDADFLSNAELSINRTDQSANWAFIVNSFKWLADDKFPIDVSRPNSTDNDIKITPQSHALLTIALKWVVPGLLLLVAIGVWIKRRRQ